MSPERDGFDCANRAANCALFPRVFEGSGAVPKKSNEIRAETQRNRALSDAAVVCNRSLEKCLRAKEKSRISGAGQGNLHQHQWVERTVLQRKKGIMLRLLAIRPLSCYCPPQKQL